MTHLRFFTALTLCGLAVSACAYVPEAAEPSWTDQQLIVSEPNAAPRFIPEETLEPSALAGYYANQVMLTEQRDAAQAAAAEIPEPEGAAEAFAAEARERAEPPDPQ